MSQAIIKTKLGKIAAAHSLKIWQSFCTPPTPPIFLTISSLFTWEKEDKKLTLVCNRGKKYYRRTEWLLKYHSKKSQQLARSKFGSAFAFSWTTLFFLILSCLLTWEKRGKKIMLVYNRDKKYCKQAKWLETLWYKRILTQIQCGNWKKHDGGDLHKMACWIKIK